MGITKIDGALSRAGIEESLQVKGVKIGPENLDATFVKFSYEASQLSYLENVLPFSELKTVDALSAESIAVLGQAGTSSLITTNQQNSKLLALALSIQYDAAGLAADTGQIFKIYVRLATGGIFYTCIGWSYTVLASDIIQYIGGSTNIQHPIIIPWNYSLDIRIVRQTGTGNFPANTSFVARGVAHLRKRGLYI